MTALSRLHSGAASQTEPPDLRGADSVYGNRRVAWAGGSDAKELAGVLSNDEAVRTGANLEASCVDSRAELLVLSNQRSFDLCNVIVPHGFDRAGTRSIVAAVGGGPHSLLAATVADWLSLRLEVPATVVYGYRDRDELVRGEDVMATTAARVPRLEVRAAEASSPAALVETFPLGTLLVVGAPGGSWFQRRFFGPGARIQAKASGGTIVVRHSPARIFQVMGPPVAYGPNMRVSDALKLSEDSDVVVADRGKLLGTVSADDLRAARNSLELHHIMEYDWFLSPSDEVSDAVDLFATHGGPIPVVDNHKRLIGCVTEADLSTSLLV